LKGKCRNSPRQLIQGKIPERNTLILPKKDRPLPMGKFSPLFKDSSLPRGEHLVLKTRNQCGKKTLNGTSYMKRVSLGGGGKEPKEKFP